MRGSLETVTLVLGARLVDAEIKVRALESLLSDNPSSFFRICLL